jgi:hypothetical protein
MTRTTRRPPEPRFEVEWTTEAWTEVRALPPLERRPIMRAAASLTREAELEARTRAPLVARSGGLPKATWETRIRGGHRLRYCIVDPVREADRGRVWILRAVIEEKTRPRGTAPRATTPRAEARELERRSKALEQIGGGIPHQVVHRAWLVEVKRELRSGRR